MALASANLVPGDRLSPGIGDCAAVKIHGIRRGEEVHRSATAVGNIDVEYDFVGSTMIGTKADDRRKVMPEQRPGQQETERTGNGRLMTLNVLIRGADDPAGLVAVRITVDGPSDFEPIFNRENDGMSPETARPRECDLQTGRAHVGPVRGFLTAEVRSPIHG